MTLAVSIPLEQGSVFRQALTYSLSKKVSLNPFGTGQCLSTKISCLDGRACEVSIPLEQGSVFRHENCDLIETAELSQSLWNRAVSFDSGKKAYRSCLNVSIPLEQGSVFRLQWCFEALWHKAYESHFPTFSETQRVGS